MLPGDTTSRFEAGLCEFCNEAPARVGLCTEADSFGSEITPVCHECLEKALNKPKEQEKCDWCKTIALLTPTRDPDEGSHGPVYHVCAACVEKQNDYYIELERREEDSQWD